MPKEAIQAELNKFKDYELRVLNDDDYFEIMVFVAFYSGFKASTVSSRRDVIKGHFPSVQIVANYGREDVDRILADTKMIRHLRKIESTTINARQLIRLPYTCSLSCLSTSAEERPINHAVLNVGFPLIP